MEKEKKKDKKIDNNSIKKNRIRIDIKSFNKLIRYENRSLLSFTNIVFIFFISAFIGWLIEIGYVYLTNGVIVNRGMSYGPYCSIYGFGSLILYLFFHNVERKKINIPYIFIATSILMGAFELLCGLSFKYLLGIEMWNYEGQYLEILHYTTVPILIGWGILGTVFVFFIQPFMLKIISLIPKDISKSIATVLLIIYFVDFIFSTFNIYLNPEILQKLVNPNL